MLPIAKLVPKYNSRVTRSFMREGEQEVLLSLIDDVQPRSMIEFGVNEGITALAVLEYFPDIERYVGVDVLPDHRLSIPAQQVEVPQHPGRLVYGDPRFELVIRHDHDDSGIVGPFDLSFIDGDHGFEAVIKDYWLSRQLVKNGMIIFHDYLNPSVEVTAALDLLHRKGHDIYHVPRTWLAFEWIV